MKKNVIEMGAWQFFFIAFNIQNFLMDVCYSDCTHVGIQCEWIEKYQKFLIFLPDEMPIFNFEE